MLSGLFHLGVLAVVGGAWEGAVSWRKPILFGLSTGVTCISLAWVLGLYRGAPGWRRSVSGLFGSAAVVEVGIITLQTWRGVPSHFNTATPLDRLLTTALDALILSLLAIILLLTAASFVYLKSDRVRRAMRLSIQAGMVWLSFASLFGLWMMIYGLQRVAVGVSPEVYGTAGVLKFVHGVPIHAVQWLPLLAWALERGRPGWSEAQRTRLVGLATLGIGLQTLFATLQTFAGRSRLDATPETLALLILGLAAFVIPWLVALLHPPSDTLEAGETATD